MATWISGEKEQTRSCSVGATRRKMAGNTHTEFTRHRSNSERTYPSNSCYSCPDLAAVKREISLRQPKVASETHRELHASASLCDGHTSPKQGTVDKYSRHIQSPTSRPSSCTDRCSSRGSATVGNSQNSRKLSCVSSCRSSSEVDCISFDEELDLSKVIPEIRIDVSARCSPMVPYKDQNIIEILDFLFLGDIEAASREPLLCRLTIEYLVDVSNLTPQQMRRSVKLKDCPCLCPSERKHTRRRLTVVIDETFSEDIEQYFEEINSFIEGARKTGNKVLLFCVNGRTVSPTLVIQYLMKTLNWNFKQACTFVRSRQADIQIPNGYQRALLNLERHLFPLPTPSPESIGDDSPTDLSRYGSRSLAWT